MPDLKKHQIHVQQSWDWVGCAHPDGQYLLCNPETHSICYAQREEEGVASLGGRFLQWSGRRLYASGRGRWSLSFLHTVKIHTETREGSATSLNVTWRRLCHSIGSGTCHASVNSTHSFRTSSAPQRVLYIWSQTLWLGSSQAPGGAHYFYSAKWTQCQTSFQVPISMCHSQTSPEHVLCTMDRANAETHNQSKCRESVSVKRSVTNATSVSYPFPKAQGPLQKRCQKDSKNHKSGCGEPEQDSVLWTQLDLCTHELTIAVSV